MAITDHAYEHQIGMRFVQNLFPGIAEQDAESMYWNIVVSGDTRYLDQSFLPYQVEEIKRLLATHRVPGGWLWNYENIYPLAQFYLAEITAIRNGLYPNPYTSSPDPVLKAQWDQQVAQVKAAIQAASAAGDLEGVNTHLETFTNLVWSSPPGMIPVARVPLMISEAEKPPSKLHNFIESYGKVFVAAWKVAATIATLGIAKAAISKYISGSTWFKDAVADTNKFRAVVGEPALKQEVIDKKIDAYVTAVASRQIPDMTNRELGIQAIEDAATEQDRAAAAPDLPTIPEYIPGAEDGVTPPSPVKIEKAGISLPGVLVLTGILGSVLLMKGR